MLLLGAWAGCPTPRQQHLADLHDSPPLTLFFVQLFSEDPLPEDLLTAEAQFHRAEAAYDAGRFPEAASGFLAAAQTLRIGQRTARASIVDTYFGNRRFCYYNAASAFSAAGDIEGGRAALAAAARADPEWAGLLVDLQAELSPR